MDSVKFRYDINYQEAYDTFYAILDRRSRTSKIIVFLLLAVCAASTTVMYARQPQYIGYSFLAFLCVLMMFGVWYVPVLKAKKGAGKVSRTGGNYELKLRKEGYLELKKGQKIYLNGDKDVRACETELVFAIRPNREMTFCIPKRIMNADEIIFVREVLKLKIKHFQRKEGVYERGTDNCKED